VIDFARQQVLAFLRMLAFGDIDGDAGDTHDVAALVEGGGRRADAPAHLTVGADDPELRLIRFGSLRELGDRLAQFISIVRVQEHLDVRRGDHESLGV
jgi:hypothetical protein